jgi:hypothetical protein
MGPKKSTSTETVNVEARISALEAKVEELTNIVVNNLAVAYIEGFFGALLLK